MKRKLFTILSMVLVLTMLLVSVQPISAESVIAFNKENSVTWESKIDDILWKLIDMENNEELIPVYIWYKDINQNEVDSLTTIETGLTPEKCQVIDALSNNDKLGFKQGDKDNVDLKSYYRRTEEYRKKERELTDLYVNTHRIIANQKYVEKCECIKDQLNIKENVIFSSKFVPMMIAELTPNQILNSARNDNVESISPFRKFEAINPDEEYIVEEPTDVAAEAEYAKESMGLTEVYSQFGLTGTNVKVGLVEINIPGPVPQGDGLEQLEIDLNDVTVVETANHHITPDINTPSSSHSHPYNTYRVMAGNVIGIAQNIDMYATNLEYENIEEMLSRNIHILEVNVSYLIYDRYYYNLYDENSEYTINTAYAYNDIDKYYDFLVAHHHVTTVVAGGNYGAHENDWFGKKNNNDPDETPKWHNGARITSPGMAYNVITVGGYDNNGTIDKSDDFLVNYSWKNSNENMYGVEKPDVIMPVNFPGRGTSVASPALTATIALMLELKPSLTLYPQIVKAIVLASCHRKVQQNNTQGGQELITNGITERQGAGTPDAWIMAEIICQNTYGMGTLNGVSDFINIEQPPYESTYMNISATWLKENTANNNHTMNSGISEGQSFDLRLNIYQSNSLIKYSDLLHSSTEMCYFSASNDNYRYGIQIVQNGSPASVKYGYAWSTDVMDYAPATNDGIYFLRSKDTNRYIFNDPAETNSHLKLKPKHVTIQNNFTDAHKWILKTTPTNYTLMTGYSTDAMYLGISNVSYGNAKYAALTNTAYELNILNNSDGTCTILSNDNTRMLSYSAGKMVWIPFTNLNDVPTVAKWFFDKVNFSQGDANADGEINIADLVYMQRAIDHIDTPTNIQAFLGDINRDGYYDSYDILALQNKLTP